LRARLLRTIGDPRERFAEDHLRLLRAARLAAQLGLTIEPATLAALKASVSKILDVSAERIREELVKLFRPPQAARGLELLRETGLLEPILPEIAATIDCEQSPDFHPEGSVYNHLLRVLEQLPQNAAPSLAWAALLHDVGKPATASRDSRSGPIHFYGHEIVGADIARSVLQRLKFPRRQTEEIVSCVRQHMQFKDVLGMRKSTLRQLLLRSTFPLELELHRIDCLGSHGRLDHYEFLVEEARQLSEQPAIRPPLIAGQDLAEMGLKPGPAMGRILREVREKQLQDELKTKAEARAWVRARLSQP
jgi:putative nucleotidyltransferase with HDIG domain